MRVNHCTAAILAAMCLGAAVTLPAAASGDKLQARLAAADLQRSEQLIAGAMQVADEQEIRRQRLQLAKQLGAAGGLFGLEHHACVQAAQSLFNLAGDLAMPGSARIVVVAEGDRRDYRTYMASCERRLGLPAPHTPNLR